MNLPLLLALLLATGCATASTLPVPVAPNPNADEVQYETRVDLDPATGDLRATSNLRFQVGAASPQRVAFLLNRGLQVGGVTGPQVRSFTTSESGFSPLWNLVEVDFVNTVTPGSLVSVRFEYSGRPELPEDQINSITPQWVELSLDSQWHPVISTFDRSMTGVLRIGLPREWQVVGSGSVTYADAAHVVRNDVPQVDVAFSAAPVLQQTALPEFTIYSRAVDSLAVAAVGTAAGACATYLNAMFGARDPLPPGKLVLANRPGPGYARKNYIVLSEVDPADSIGLHQFLCHELAHYWTQSAGSFSPHHWMTEAFAEYVAARFLRQRFGPEAFEPRRAQWEQAGRAHGPVWSPDVTQRPSFMVMYRRAPYLLALLEERIGAEAFDRFVTLYMTERVTTTPELLGQLRIVAGAEVEQWFRAELARRPD